MPSTNSTGNKPIVVPVAAEALDLLQVHRLKPSRYPFYLQSVAQPVAHISYDILFACPQYSLQLTADGKLEINTDFPDADDHTSLTNIQLNDTNSNFLQTFEQYWQQARQGWEGDSELPFSGGWFVYLGYELAKQIEPVLQGQENKKMDFATANAARVPAAIIRNHSTNQCYVVIEKKYQNLLSQIKEDIECARIQHSVKEKSAESDSIIASISEEDPQEYLANVTKIKKYIKDGDVFQVNLSRQWTATLQNGVSAAQLYTRLSQANPAPFFALAEFGDNAIISSSPERLVKVNGSLIDTRPIAGTRPRGYTVDADKEKLEELISHPKERAEHIMLIDLERNDLGRVCVPGSVKVNELMVLESYSHVHHIVSNVQGRLRNNVTPSDVIKAVFPGGTITGCPKVRCMQIIAELEKADRGPYTGSLGYINHSGNMDLNILIRTLVKQGNKLNFRAGAGIVADSNPENELEETRAKAKGLLLAL